MIKITLITVTFNSHRTIEDTIKSVEAQRYPNLEYIIVDGFSSDNTLEIARRYSHVISKVVSERDNGIYDAMNKGLALASGEVVGLINSDDVLADEQVLQRVSKVFFDNPGVDGCYGDLCYVRNDDLAKIVRYWHSSSYRHGLFRKGWVPPHPTLYVRKDIYNKFGGFDLNYKIAADFELMLRLFEVHHVHAVYLPHILVKMRLGGTTNRNLKNILLQNLEIWRALRNHNISFFLASLVLNKAWTRFLQFIQRPQ